MAKYHREIGDDNGASSMRSARTGAYRRWRISVASLCRIIARCAAHSLPLAR
jgi:hypothetical protein